MSLFRLIFDGKDDTTHDPIAQSSFSYTFSNDDRKKVCIYVLFFFFENLLTLKFRLMSYVHGYYPLQMMKFCMKNLIFNLFYQNRKHLMINRLKRMEME